MQIYYNNVLLSLIGINFVNICGHVVTEKIGVELAEQADLENNTFMESQNTPLFASSPISLARCGMLLLVQHFIKIWYLILYLIDTISKSWNMSMGNILQLHHKWTRCRHQKVLSKRNGNLQKVSPKSRYNVQWRIFWAQFKKNCILMCSLNGDQNYSQAWISFTLQAWSFTITTKTLPNYTEILTSALKYLQTFETFLMS